MTTYKGIDYVLGRTNVSQSGIRFGVIPHHELGESWYESAESDYGDAHCPKCGNEAKECKGTYAKFEHAKHECDDYVCHSCKYVFGSESAYDDTPQAFTLDSEGIKARQGGDDADIFVLASPYFTYAQFCSPCAPGACYLMNPLDLESACCDGVKLDEAFRDNKAYCFGHDWFEGGVAPYPVYSVETGELIQAENKL